VFPVRPPTAPRNRGRMMMTIATRKIGNELDVLLSLAFVVGRVAEFGFEQVPRRSWIVGGFSNDSLYRACDM
jgi:hypothetical protein